MTEINELYQELIVDHGRHPRNFKKLSDCTVSQEGFNPLCGDRLTLFLKIEHDRVVDASFEGKGCAISIASASLMTEILKGKSVSEVKKIFDAFHASVTNTQCNEQCQSVNLGKLSALSGVRAYPSRIKCATLAWHTMVEVIKVSAGETKEVRASASTPGITK